MHSARRAMRDLYHVTLSTGHVRMSARSEVSESALAYCAELLARAIARQAAYADAALAAGMAMHGHRPGPAAAPPEPDPLPIHATDCALTAAAYGRCLLATIWGPPREPGATHQRGHVLTLAGGVQPPQALATIGVATHSRCGSHLWRELHDMPGWPAATDRAECPPEPWCGVQLEYAIALQSDTAAWLGDFERCLAWAWVAGVKVG